MECRCKYGFPTRDFEGQIRDYTGDYLAIINLSLLYAENSILLFIKAMLYDNDSTLLSLPREISHHIKRFYDERGRLLSC